jgi:hypothetical protein
VSDRGTSGHPHSEGAGPNYPQPPPQTPSQYGGNAGYGGYGQPNQPGYYNQQPNQFYPPPQPPGAALQTGRERNILAAILIGAGLFFFIQQVSPFSFGDFVLPVVGGALILAAMNTRAAYGIGFLIPGCILLGIGAGNLIERYTPLRDFAGIDIGGLTLGLGFCLIWVLSRYQWWALIPGSILIVSSLGDFWFFTRLWPLALIGLGAYLLYEQYRRRPRA